MPTLCSPGSFADVTRLGMCASCSPGTYVDTEGAFRPERIEPIAARFGLEPADVLENILFARVHTADMQMDALTHIAALCAEQPFRLLIVDSVTALFRVDYQGRGELADRQMKLGLLLSRMKKLAEEFNLAVVMSNQVMADPSGQMFVTDPKKHVGGHVIAHASTVRLMARKGRGDTRVIKVIQHPSKGEAEAIWGITDEGVIDAES